MGCWIHFSFFFFPSSVWLCEVVFIWCGWTDGFLDVVDGMTGWVDGMGG